MTIVVYLKCDDATTRPSLTCHGLVCIPLPDWVNVLNPTTGELLSFPSGPTNYGIEHFPVPTKWYDVFPGYWAMGFGRDEVKGSYKVVRMLFDFNKFEILDINIGEWRKLSPPPYKIEATRKSACVNGSIYWLNYTEQCSILAFDLHTEEFRDLAVLPPPRYSFLVQIFNLEDRLAIADPRISHDWTLEIWIMDAQEETWTMTYSIRLVHRVICTNFLNRWFRPMAVSKRGNLFFYDSDKRLFKYYPKIDCLICISPDICVENLVSLGLKEGCVPRISTSRYQYGLSYLREAGCVPNGYLSQIISSIVGRRELLIPNILLTSTLLSLVVFGYR